MAAASKAKLKLLVDTKSQKVLFAEANKNAVDCLLHILTLPITTVIRLLTKQRMVGCLGNLYESIENLDETYIQPNQTKETLLRPTTPLGLTNFTTPLLSLPPGTHETPSISVYRCTNYNSYDCRAYFSDDPRANCPSCGCAMNHKLQYVAPPPPPANNNAQMSGEGAVAQADGDGFVKGVVTYMVMDDLEVKPMSTISSITILNQFNVKEVAALEERVVDLGMNEALKLLETSLSSNAVLTSLFLSSLREPLCSD